MTRGVFRTVPGVYSLPPKRRWPIPVEQFGDIALIRNVSIAEKSAIIKPAGARQISQERKRFIKKSHVKLQPQGYTGD
jgi:hypothetical protein